MSRSHKHERETLVFGRYIDWETEATLGTVRFGSTDSRPFAAISPHTVEKLVEKGYLKRGSQHNDAPTVGEFLELAEELQTEYDDQLSIGFNGFMISPQRADSRIRLDGFFVGASHQLSPEVIQYLVGRFDPDLITAGQTFLEFWWD